MSGVLVVLTILLCFVFYISLKRQQRYQRSEAASASLIQMSIDSEVIYQTLIKSAKQALSTDNPNDSNLAATATIDSYNKLASLLDNCNLKIQLVKPERLAAASSALALVQTRVQDGKARVNDAIKYVVSIPNSVFDMARCPKPCYADNSK